MQGTVLVTGATGFIGAAVVAALASRGRAVRAGIRKTPLAPSLSAQPSVAAAPCDLDDPRSLRLALEGATSLVHAAYGGGSETLRQEKALLAAARGAGVRRLVHLSSIAVYGGHDGAAPEDAPGTPPFGPYERLKRASEASIAAWCAETGGSAALLRAGAVWGPRSTLWVEGLLRRIRSGGWRDFGARGEGLAPLIHVDDVAAAVVAALDAALPPREARAFNIVHPQKVTWNRYAASLAAAADERAPARTGAAAFLAFSLAATPAKALRRLGMPTIEALADFPGAGERALLARQASYPVDRARRELGWTPRVDLDDGLARLYGEGPLSRKR